MAQVNVAAECAECGREAHIPIQHFGDGAACRGCSKPIQAGVFVIEDDSTLRDTVERAHVFVAFLTASQFQGDLRHFLCATATKFAGRALVCVASPSACPEGMEQSEETTTPAYAFWAKGTKLSSVGGLVATPSVWKWMFATLKRYAMPPSKRPPLPCIRCQGRRLIRCFPVEHGLDSTQGDPAVALRRMAVTHTALRERVDVAEIGGSRAAWVKQESDGAVGELEAFVCQSCGFVEWYAGSPERIPIGPAHRTELIEIPERGPYR